MEGMGDAKRGVEVGEGKPSIGKMLGLKIVSTAQNNSLLKCQLDLEIFTSRKVKHIQN